MIDVEPPKLSFCRRRGSRFGGLYLSRSTSLFPVRAVITCRGALGCGVVAGAGQRRGAAGGVCRCMSREGCQRKSCSRSPHRDRPTCVTCWPIRRVCRYEMVLVSVEVSAWAWWF